METELKSLKTRRTKLQNEIRDIKNEVTQLKSERDDKNKTIDAHLSKIKSLEKELESLKQKEKEHQDASDGIVVTEHAIIRYFERVLGFDVEKIKRQMIPEKTRNQIKVMKSGLFPEGNGKYKLRVRDGTVVTLVTED